jgi:hypothetical protein
MNWPAAVEKALWAVGGGFLSLITAYYTTGKELAFIKGQLSQLMHFFGKVEACEKQVVLVTADVIKLQKDVTSAHEKLRVLQKTRP